MTNDLEEAFFKRFSIEPEDKDGTLVYPQITDRLLLELIVIHSNYDSDRLMHSYISYEFLRDRVLRGCINLYKIKRNKKFKQQIQELFKHNN